MQVVRTLEHILPFDARALRTERRWLYRRATDRDVAVLGVGCRRLVESDDPGEAIESWTDLVKAGHPSMGFLTYDLREPLFGQRSRHPRSGPWPLMRWFVPEVMVLWEDGRTRFLGTDPAVIDRLIARLTAAPPVVPSGPWGPWVLSTDKTTYLGHTARLLEHIQRGDIYEVNYCVERTGHLPGRDPHAAFMRGSQRTQAAFAAFHAWDDRYAICLSPERFLWTTAGRVHCEPMKGTRRRAQDPAVDRAIANELANDPKERAENIMATDVVRNDLSRVAAPGSVRVPELCGIRTTGPVHQMVSRVEARLDRDRGPADAVRSAFPMASMTGAPKHRAMDLIDRHEDQRRGLFSGTIGWCDGAGDLDLNVVIRTVEYDGLTGEARLVTGSALTAACDPESEWEECALKACSVIDALDDAGA